MEIIDEWARSIREQVGKEAFAFPERLRDTVESCARRLASGGVMSDRSWTEEIHFLEGWPGGGQQRKRETSEEDAGEELSEPLAAYGRDPLPPPPVCFPGGGVRERIREIKAGLPMACFDELREALGCSQESLAVVAGIPARTLARRRQEGRFRPDEGERVLRLVRVFEDALRLFENDAAAARRWLGTPRELFEGRTPLEYCDTEPGAGFVRDVVGRLEHGVFS